MAFRVRLKLTNSTGQQVTTKIPAGTVFEVIDPFSHVQNLMTIAATSVVIPAGGVQIVEIDSWCVNKSFSPPSATPMRATPFRAARPYRSQDDVWADLGRRR